MIHHILQWSYKNETPREERARIESELVALPSRIPMLERVEWGHIVDGNNPGYTRCFIMDFADMDAVKAYIIHPAHEEFAVSFRAAYALHLVVDVEVQNG